MCLYPRLIKNKKYQPTKKNNYTPQLCFDPRLLYIPIGCGNCIECRQQKAREWRIRLSKEIEDHKYKYFVTLTFSNENLKKLCEELKITESNAVAGLAVRRFLERWRKKYKKSIKHWLATELGQNESERIHLHGILMPEKELDKAELESIWKYGFADTGKFVNLRTINYIIKYITKIDLKHKGFQSQVFCSAGLGKKYLEEYYTVKKHAYKPKQTIEYLTLPNGDKCNLPIYYRNKIFDENTREKLWQDRLDKGIIYVRGIPCNVKTEEGREKYNRIIETQQQINKSMGYGDSGKEWKKKEYNVTLRMINEKPKK